MLVSTVEIVFVCICLSLASVAFLFRSPRPHDSLPPGPSKIPFFGNLFQLSTLRAHPQFLVWARQYGSLFRLKLGPQNVISLNSADAADQLLVHRSKKYSSRAETHVAQDVMSLGQRLALLPYGEELKAARKSLQPFLGSGSSKHIRPLQEMESRVLLYHLMTHEDKTLKSNAVRSYKDDIPEGHWILLVRRYAASVVMMLTYGKRMHTTKNNPLFKKLFEVMENFTKVARPGTNLADVFPILRMLPDWLAPWRVAARKMHAWEMELYGGYLKDLQAELKENKDPHSYAGTYLKERASSGNADAPGYGLTDDGWMRDGLLAYSAGTLLEAGADTTSGTLQTVILQLLGNPRVLRKAREEVDREIPSNRLPTFEDEAKLPYVVACIKESLRCRAPIPLGVPHSLDEDDTWNGYLIPKNSTVIGNIWGIHMDPARYPDPSTYNPDRFFTEDQPVRWGSGPDSKNRDHYAFGWGRRFCPGSFVAEASLFVVLSRILWGIDLKAPVDPVTGKEVLPDTSDEEMFADGFTNSPRAFSVGFSARSAERAAIIRSAYEDAQIEFEALGLAVDERIE